MTLAVCVQSRRAGGGADGGAHFMFCLYLCKSCYICASVCEILCATHSTVFQPHAPVRSCQTFRIILRRPPGAKQRQNKLPDNIRQSPSLCLPTSSSCHRRVDVIIKNHMTFYCYQRQQQQRS